MTTLNRYRIDTQDQQPAGVVYTVHPGMNSIVSSAGSIREQVKNSKLLPELRFGKVHIFSEWNDNRQAYVIYCVQASLEKGE